jgi:hypothetical protein
MILAMPFRFRRPSWRIFFLTHLAFSALLRAGAQDITLSGLLLDPSGEPVVGASVSDTLSRRGTQSNAAGYFSLRTPAGAQALRVSHAAHAPMWLIMTASRDTFLRIALQDRSSDAVVISADPLALRPLSEMSVSRVPISLVKALPALMGERDLLKALALMPGVAVGSEGSSGLLVRGGSPDQNLLLLDGAPVYNASHLFGFLSIFNPDAIKDAALYKGGFPARYGGRLSSVLDVTLREGASARRSAEGGIGIVSSRGLLEGPLGKGSYLLSGRSSYLGLLLLPVRLLYRQGNADAYYSYWMGDLNAKFSHPVGKTGRLSLSLYGGYDRYGAVDGSSGPESRFGLAWGNQTATLRYAHTGRRWFGQALLLYSRYQYRLDVSQRDSLRIGDSSFFQTARVSSQSLVRDLGATYRLEGYLCPRLTLRLGAELTRHQFQPALFLLRGETGEQRQGASPIRTWEAGAYAEASWRPAQWMELNGGMRVSAYAAEGARYAGPEPRLSMGFQLPGRFQLKASYSQMRQYLHLLSNSGVGLPNDIWVPVTAQIPPSRAVQAGLALEKQLPALKLFLSAEVYAKRLSGLSDYARGANFLDVFASDWQQFLLTGGEGRIQGLELFAQRTQGRFSGWMSYTLSRNERRFPQAEGGAWYPFRYDRRHVAALAGVYALSKRWKVSATFSYSSGFPVTVPVARALSPEGFEVWVYPARGNYRSPSYQRLDIGFDHSRLTRRGRERIFSFGCYNALNRQNPFYLDIVSQADPVTGISSNRLVQRSFLPILPYFGWSWK